MVSHKHLSRCSCRCPTPSLGVLRARFAACSKTAVLRTVKPTAHCKEACLQVYAAAEHSRYVHSMAVGVLARKLGKEVSNRLLADEDAAAGAHRCSHVATMRLERSCDIPARDILSCVENVQAKTLFCLRMPMTTTAPLEPPSWPAHAGRPSKSCFSSS